MPRNERRSDALVDHGWQSHPEKQRKDSSSQDSARRKSLASSGAKAASKCHMTGRSGMPRNERRSDALVDHSWQSHPEKQRKDSSSQDSARRKSLASSGAKAASKCHMTGCKADLCFREHVPRISLAILDNISAFR